MRVFIAVFCLIFSLHGNFSGSYALAENQLDSLRLELSMLSSQIEDLRKGLLSPEVRSLNPSDAGIAILRLEALEAKLRAAVGRVEALEFNLQILSKDANNRIKEFNTRLLELEGNKYTNPELEKSHNSEKSRLPKNFSGGASSDETLFFDKALIAFDSGEFIEAIEKFKEFLKLYPLSINNVEAHYRLGEANFNANKFKESAREYLKSFSLDPVGAYASRALLGLAVSLGRLGKAKQGCLTLGELKMRHEGDLAEILPAIRRAEDQLQCT